jgi:hypothetical protein
MSSVPHAGGVIVSSLNEIGDIAKGELRSWLEPWFQTRGSGNLIGPRGPAGPTGATGATGPAGAAGVTPGYGTSLPGSPAGGDEYILVDSTSNPTYQWRFRYNSGSSSTYKWEFVGGSILTAQVAADESSATTAAWTDLTTAGPLIVVPRAGDYVCAGAASVYTTAGAGTGLQLGIASGATTPGAGVIATANSAGAGYVTSMSVAPQTLTAVASGADVRLRYYGAAATLHAYQRQLAVTPRRVS